MEGRAARRPLWQRIQRLLHQRPLWRQQDQVVLVLQGLLGMPHAVAVAAVCQRQAAPGQREVQPLFQVAAQRRMQACCCCCCQWLA